MSIFFSKAIGDYESEPTIKPVVLPGKVNFETVTMRIINDNVEEEPEWFNLVLTATEGAVVTENDPETAVVTIFDDDRKWYHFVVQALFTNLVPQTCSTLQPQT